MSLSVSPVPTFLMHDCGIFGQAALMLVELSSFTPMFADVHVCCLLIEQQSKRKDTLHIARFVSVPGPAMDQQEMEWVSL